MCYPYVTFQAGGVCRERNVENHMAEPDPRRPFGLWDYSLHPDSRFCSKLRPYYIF